MAMVDGVKLEIGDGAPWRGRDARADLIDGEGSGPDLGRRGSCAEVSTSCENEG